MKVIDRIALVLVIIGGLNWGSIGIFGLDIVAALFGGSASGLSRLVYILDFTHSRALSAPRDPLGKRE